jgi:hypothetical protein
VTAVRYLRRAAGEVVVEEVVAEEAVAAAELPVEEEFRTFRLYGSHSRNPFPQRRAFIAFPGLQAAAVDVAAARQLPGSSL